MADVVNHLLIVRNGKSGVPLELRTSDVAAFDGQLDTCIRCATDVGITAGETGNVCSLQCEQQIGGLNPTAAQAAVTVKCPTLDLCETLTLGTYEAATYRARDGKLIPCRMDEKL